tara:strand:+ start:1107 stop:1430 length:324 start_codon:yes stop_codon:yes gene_type:complete
MLGTDKGENRMAITKELTEDKIEVVGDYKTIQVRTATVIKEDSVELSRSFHRHTLDCVSSVKNDDDSWTHTDTDVSGESTEVQDIATAVWTTTVKNAKKAANEAASI